MAKMENLEEKLHNLNVHLNKNHEVQEKSDDIYIYFHMSTYTNICIYVCKTWNIFYPSNYSLKKYL